MAALHAVHHRPTIVIAGGGVAGIEALLALRADVGGTAHIELMSAELEFVYRPTAVAEPFGLGEVHRLELADVAADQNAAFRHAALRTVEPESSSVLTSTGERVAYDYLVVATGCKRRPVIEGAVTFGGPGDREALERVLAQARSGEVKSIAFIAPAGSEWLMPLYELALLTSWWTRKHRTAPALSLHTDEARPLEAFGARASELVSALLFEAGIEFVSGTRVPAADAVVAIPQVEGPYVAGLPHDELGFIPTDRNGSVIGAPRVYAAGDSTSFPIKQGGIAAQQADAAAAAIAHSLGARADREPFRPVLRGMLLTGDLPRFMRSAGDSSEAGVAPLWWPPAKIAARHLGPYLAERPLTRTTLSDRAAADDDPDSVERDERDAVALLLELADANARRGSYRFALRCLQAAEDVAGPLPPERQADRRAWEQHVTR